MSGDDLVNYGHLVAWLDPNQFDKIPGKLLVDNFDEFRDSLEEQKKNEGFKHLIKNITKKYIRQRG